MLSVILQALFQSSQHLFEKKGRIRVWIRIREAQKLSDPDPVLDPDPQHWRLEFQRITAQQTQVHLRLS